MVLNLPNRQSAQSSRGICKKKALQVENRKHSCLNREGKDLIAVLQYSVHFWLTCSSLFTALSAPLKGKTWCTSASYIILSYLINYEIWTFLHLLCVWQCFLHLLPPYNPVEEESRTLFHGEDFHILLPSLSLLVTFRNRSTPRSPEVVLMRDGVMRHTRAKLNRQLSHLVVDSVGEGDEGVYTVKNPDNPEDVRRITLIVRGTGWHHRQKVTTTTSGASAWFWFAALMVLLCPCKINNQTRLTLSRTRTSTRLLLGAFSHSSTSGWHQSDNHRMKNKPLTSDLESESG